MSDSGKPPPIPDDEVIELEVVEKRDSAMRLGEPLHVVPAADPAAPPIAIETPASRGNAARAAQRTSFASPDESDAQRRETPLPATAPSSAVKPPAPLYLTATRLRVAVAAAVLLAVIAFFAPAFVAAIAALRGSPSPPFTAPVDQSLSLSILSTPAHASVTVDGAARGHTPSLINLTCESGSSVAVTITAPGYQPWTAKVPCVAGAARSVNAQLKR